MWMITREGIYNLADIVAMEVVEHEGEYVVAGKTYEGSVRGFAVADTYDKAREIIEEIWDAIDGKKVEVLA